MNMIHLHHLILVFMLLSIQACASGPKIEFTSDKKEITEGEVISLTWKAFDAETVSIEPNVGDVAIDSYIKLSPQQSTKYILTASNKSGVSTQAIKIKVVPDITFSFSSLNLAGEEYLALRWKVKGAEKISISPNVGDLEASGMKIVPLSYSNSFTLTAETIVGESKSKKLLVEKNDGDDLSELIKKMNASGPWDYKTVHRIIKMGTSTIPLLISELKSVLIAEEKLVSIVKNNDKLSESQNKQLSRYLSIQIKILFIFGALQDVEAIPIILEVAKSTSPGVLFQVDIFRVLLKYQGNQQVKDYIASVLDSDESSALQLRWSLFSLNRAKSDLKNTADYAIKFMQEKYDLSVREVAVLIAAEQGVEHIKPIIISLLNEDAEPQWKNSAMEALALVVLPNEFIEITSKIELEAEEKLASIGLSRLNMTSLEDKQQAIGEIFQSKSYIGRTQALEYIFANNRVDLLEKYSILMSFPERTWYWQSLQKGIYLKPLKLLPLLFNQDDVKLIESFNGLVRGTALKPILSIKQHHTARID